MSAMSYDRADYDLAKYTVRIAFFVTGAMLSGLAGEMHLEDDQELLAKLYQREVTPGHFFTVACDCKFWEADLNAEGNRFARDYYMQHCTQDGYFEDYARVLLAEYGELESVVDCWANYDKIASVIAVHYERWKNGSK